MDSIKSPESQIVYFEEDEVEAKIIMYFFKSLSFEYNGMSSKPTSYNYTKLKDIIKWSGAKPRHYINLIDNMFYSYRASLPKK